MLPTSKTCGPTRSPRVAISCKESGGLFGQFSSVRMISMASPWPSAPSLAWSIRSRMLLSISVSLGVEFR